jgi:predicted dehydrogenase
MNEKIKVGLVGYGGSARLFHLPFIKAVPELEIHAILQRSPPGSATPHCTIDYPHVKHYQELGGFLGDEQIQLVVICSATSTHVSIATAALKAGKHGWFKA